MWVVVVSVISPSPALPPCQLYSYLNTIPSTLHTTDNSAEDERPGDNACYQKERGRPRFGAGSQGKTKSPSEHAPSSILALLDLELLFRMGIVVVSGQLVLC